MNIKAAMLLLLLFLVQRLALSSEIFEFKYVKGTKFRLEGKDNQKVYLTAITIQVLQQIFKFQVK